MSLTTPELYFFYHNPQMLHSSRRVTLPGIVAYFIEARLGAQAYGDVLLLKYSSLTPSLEETSIKASSPHYLPENLRVSNL